MKRWFTDGVSDRLIEELAPIPEGFYPGRKIKGEKRGKYSSERCAAISEACKGRVAHSKGKKEVIKHVYYTNGEISIRVPFDATPPPGFVRGRLKKRLDEESRTRFSEKVRTTKLERYGSPTYNNMQKNSQTKLLHYGNPKFNNSAQTKVTNIERYGVPVQFMRTGINYPHQNSRPNIEFEKYLQDKGFVDIEREFAINSARYSYDFKVNNVLIEIDPYPYHNSTASPLKQIPPKDKDYHFKKSETARECNYRCIHIWDWDDVDKVISTLKRRPYTCAHNCSVREITVEEEKAFLNSYHLQNYAKSKVRIGLYLNDELVSVMTFRKPYHSKNYEWELLRYCSSYYVAGGAAKLFKYFLNNYNPSSIISYCDLAKFRGDNYKTLGFELKGISINKHWYNPRLHKHVTDKLLKQRGFNKLFGKELDIYDKSTPMDQWMIEQGFVEIYDAGQATYTWNKNTVK